MWDTIHMIIIALGSGYALYIFSALLNRANDYFESNSNAGATDKIVGSFIYILRNLSIFICVITVIPLAIHTLATYFEKKNINFYLNEEEKKTRKLIDKYNEKLEQLTRDRDFYQDAFHKERAANEDLSEKVASLEADISALLYDQQHSDLE